VYSKSGVVLLAFHHSTGHLCSVLLEDHLVAPTPRQDRGQSASASAASAARRRSINFYGCLKRSVKASEQDIQDDDHSHCVVACFDICWLPLQFMVVAWFSDLRSFSFTTLYQAFGVITLVNP